MQQKLSSIYIATSNYAELKNEAEKFKIKS